MKKSKSFIKICSIIFCVVFSLTFTMTSVKVYASEFKPKYVTPDGDDMDNMFSLTAGDVTDIFGWLTEKEDFVILEDNKWKNHAWLNVPNLQSMIYGKIDGIFACGFTESGMDLDESTKNYMYPTNSNGDTAMKQLGFSIPSITYKGECPVIEYELSSVLPSGVWGNIKSAIRFLVGGSIIEAPDTDDFNTLNYVNMTDYIEDYAMVIWIYEYWEDTVNYFKDEEMENQGLLPKSICGNKESKADGKYYTVDSCIFDNDFDNPEDLGFDLDNLDDCVVFNRLLKTTYGQYYSPVMTSIIYFSGGEEGSQLTRFSLRNMPYYAPALSDSSNIELNLVEDPRCDADAIFNIVHQKDRNSVIHKVYPMIIGFFGKISQLTWFLDQLTKFDVLESNGVNVNFLWENPVLRVICGLFSIFFVISCAKYVFIFLKGEMSAKEAIAKTVTGAFVAICLFAVVINPGDSYGLFKKVMKMPSDLAGEAFSQNTTATFMSSTATSEDKYEINYWMPYFEMWSVYNTNHTISDSSQIIDRATTYPETKRMQDTYIGSDINTRWDLTLAYSFTSGYEIKRDAYRVVDHFLAPRFNIYIDGEYSYIETTKNENFNGDIQSRVGSNWLIVIDLFFMELIKLFLFINVCIQFAFLIIFIIFRYKEEGLAPILKSFVFGIAMYFFATFMVPVVANFTYYGNSEFIPCLILTLIFFMSCAAVWKWINKCPDWMQPMLLLSIKQKKWRK